MQFNYSFSKCPTLTFFAFIVAFFSAKAQTLDSIPQIEGNYGYTAVVKVDSSIKKEDLYKRAKIFFVDAYKSTNDVIQYDDQAEGKIIGKGFLTVKESVKGFLMYYVYNWDVYFSTEIVCKDGRYKYKIYNITIKGTIKGDNTSTSKNLIIDEAKILALKGSAKKTYTLLLNKMNRSLKNNITMIDSYMNKPNSNKTEEF